MLAMAISLKRYMRNQVSAKMMSKIETKWLSKHREHLQQIDALTPRQVLRAFADDNNLTVADIDIQMDWTAWEYDSLANLTTDTPTTDKATNNE
jgi:intein-encoded DNA endonuclease-like protein